MVEFYHSEENIEKVKSKTLEKISFPWLNSDGVKGDTDTLGEIHPISAVSVRYSFFDKLHQAKD